MHVNDIRLAHLGRRFHWGTEEVSLILHAVVFAVSGPHTELVMRLVFGSAGAHLTGFVLGAPVNVNRCDQYKLDRLC